MEAMKNHLKKNYDKEEERKEARKDEDYDEEVEEGIEEELDQDDYLLGKIADIIHNLFGIKIKLRLKFKKIMLPVVKF